MTELSIKEPLLAPNLLKLDRSYYYVKRSSIVEKIIFQHRTFYAKFERIDEPLEEMVISQHLNRQYIIASPLLKNGKTEYLVIEYRGMEPSRFFNAVRHLMSSLQITNYLLFKGKKESYVQLFISIAPAELEEADAMVSEISDALERRLPKEWKCFPDKSLPASYNIITLPYKKLAH